MFKTAINTEKDFTGLLERISDIIREKKNMNDFEGVSKADSLLRESFVVFGDYDDNNCSAARQTQLEKMYNYVKKERVLNG